MDRHFLRFFATLSLLCVFLSGHAGKKNQVNGHEYVDLGLPSGTYWATTNIGAYSPADFGIYLEWKEDAAASLWQDGWTTPTREQWEELLTLCSWRYEDRQDHAGFVVSGPSDRSIFIPCTGFDSQAFSEGYIRSIRSSTNPMNGFISRENVHPGESIFNYWSATPVSPGADMAYGIAGNVLFSAKPSVAEENKSMRLSVRPVISGRSVPDEPAAPDKETGTEFLKEYHPNSSGSLYGHQYVDLGLPGGALWSTMNLGASSPSDAGLYFAWGETASKKNFYAEEEMPDNFRKQFVDFAGDERYDAATAMWGSRWKTPSEYDIQQLIDNCDWTWSRVDGADGYIVTGSTGHSIFLPAGGIRAGRKLKELNEAGYFWSSTSWNYSMDDFDKTGFRRSCALVFSKDDIGDLDIYAEEREFGLNIRPVISDDTLSDEELEKIIEEVEKNDGSLAENPDDNSGHGHGRVRDDYRVHRYKSRFGSLEVITDPSHADLFLNGKHIGKSRKFKPLLKPGAYNLTVMKDGYQPVARQIYIMRGDTTHIFIRLQELELIEETVNTLKVVALPDSANILLDGVVVGKTPALIENIPDGWHTVQLTKDGYVPGEKITYYFQNSQMRLEGELELVSKNAEFTSFDPRYEQRGFGYIDLGLPSSQQWAVENAAAKIMWTPGITVSHDEVRQNVYPPSLTNEMLHEKGMHAAFGLPKLRDFRELMEECEKKLVTFDGQQGYILRGPNGNTIFLPLLPFYLLESTAEPGRDGDTVYFVRWWIFGNDKSVPEEFHVRPIYTRLIVRRAN